MQLIYPRYPTRIFVPVDLDGTRQRTVFQVAHRRPETTIHWHLDETYLGSTRTFHQLEMDPPAGEHRLTLVDEQGNRLEQPFTIIEKED
jgi:penicillin-binding protein 1C